MRGTLLVRPTVVREAKPGSRFRIGSNLGNCAPGNSQALALIRGRKTFIRRGRFRIGFVGDLKTAPQSISERFLLVGTYALQMNTEYNLIVGLLLISLSSTAIFSAEEGVRGFRIVQTTANVQYADTDDGFTFVVRNGNFERSRRFGDLPSDERERGQTDTYNIDFSGAGVLMSQVSRQSLLIRSRGHNSWLPSHIKITALGANGTSTLIMDDAWNSNCWFSEDHGDNGGLARTEWTMAQGATVTDTASSFRPTLRFNKANSGDRTTITVTFSGSLLTAATGASSGNSNFSVDVSVVNKLPSLVPGGSWVCDVTPALPIRNLKPGEWRLNYLVQGVFTGQCDKTLPLNRSALGRVNFRNGVAGCRTGTSFP